MPILYQIVIKYNTFDFYINLAVVSVKEIVWLYNLIITRTSLLENG